MLTTARPSSGLAALRRFIEAQPVEACEFCGTRIPADHRHVVEPATRRVLCACLVCGEAMSGRPDRRYRLVPRDAAFLPDFRMSDAEWHSLGVPVEMAFLFQSTREGRPVALYPGPLGATESLPGVEVWAALAEMNPVLAELEPDVEALLVDRRRGRCACYRVPIDRCYALVGLIRARWQGWSGGDEVWQAIAEFMDGLGA